MSTITDTITAADKSRGLALTALARANEAVDAAGQANRLAAQSIPEHRLLLVLMADVYQAASTAATQARGALYAADTAYYAARAARHQQA